MEVETHEGDFQLLLIVELALSLLIVPLAFLAPRLGNRWFSGAERQVRRLAAQPRLSALVILLLALGARVAVLPVESIPAPGIHDEFGYLLAADTFEHGRLTNPTHPMWINFESMTIIHKPTYCSAFYPAQGAFMALGQALFRHPFWGVWLSTGLMCAAICWALQAWMPPAWAFLGGLLAIVHLGVFTYWANSYWGGSTAAIGGALALGSLPRIRRRLRVGDALWMGLGFAILANSRPYEGSFYSLPILAVLAKEFVSSDSFARRRWIASVITPLALVMTLTLAFMGYYFYRTTGSPFRPAYLVDMATYMAEPQFFWQKALRTVVYRNDVMAQFYTGFHVQNYLEAHLHPFFLVVRKVANFWVFFIGPALTLPILALIGILPYGMKLRDLGPNTGFLLILCAVSFFGMLLPVSFAPHYGAPMICATYALIIQGMRRVRIWDRKDKEGIFVIRATVLTLGIIFVVTAIALGAGKSRQTLFALDPTHPNNDRATIMRELAKKSGKHLVIVHYHADHDPHVEWVYNDADIDSSKVVWAREISPQQDEQLISYFKSRQIWLLDADANPPTLRFFGGRNSE